MNAADGLARLDPAHAAYLQGGAGDEITLRANRQAWQDLPLWPRSLRPLAGSPFLVDSREGTPATSAAPSPAALNPGAPSTRSAATANSAAARKSKPRTAAASPPSTKAIPVCSGTRSRRIRTP